MSSADNQPWRQPETSFWLCATESLLKTMRVRPNSLEYMAQTITANNNCSLRRGRWARYVLLDCGPVVALEPVVQRLSLSCQTDSHCQLITLRVKCHMHHFSAADLETVCKSTLETFLPVGSLHSFQNFVLIWATLLGHVSHERLRCVAI